MYVDDCDLVTHIEEDIQYFMDSLSRFSKAFKPTISKNKTEVMYLPAPGESYVKLSKSLNLLTNVFNQFCFVDDDDDITSHIQKVSYVLSEDLRLDVGRSTL